MTVGILVQLIVAWAVALFAEGWLLAFDIIVIAACQQALLLATHEGAHIGLCKDRRTNDLWTQIAFSGAIGLRVSNYRKSHMKHHHAFGETTDPDRWAFQANPRSASFAVSLAKALTGITALQLAVRRGTPIQLVEILSVSAWQVALFMTAIAAGRPYVYPLLWLLPLFSVGVALNLLRTTAEHFDEREVVARSTKPNLPEKWLLYQVNFNYHLEHHLFPAIPWNNLPQLHKRLREDGFYDLHPFLLNTGAVRYLVRPRGPGID